MASKQIINDIDDAWAEYDGDDYMGTYFAFHIGDSLWKRKRWQHCCDVCSRLNLQQDLHIKQKMMQQIFTTFLSMAKMKLK